ncbi:DNA excision repair protein ERCC-5 [Euwallacea similis]|uniref:DNA excision repair protein ERCC-5 n=1 Tax=Euwallacea similis TaxID=1736056 RepID=UPI00344DFAB5
MGVHGLWRLIEPSGKPVPLETLENKVLAVDVSIWLHQAVKGFQDAKGASLPNAHLLGIYHRVCKLLYFKIKPVFVFDGGVPALKKHIITKRTQSKLRNISDADKIQRQLLNTLLKHTAVSKVLAEKIEASITSIPKTSARSKNDDMYHLPSITELPFSSSDEESYTESSTDSSPMKNWDLHTIDMNSVHFKSLPVDVRHEILTDLKETRKQSSWGRLHEMPKVSDDFSDYQMQRLLKRQSVQIALEEAEKEMGGKSLSLAELELMLKDQGVLNAQSVGNRIASDENKQYLLVKDVKKALEEARQKEKESLPVEESDEVPNLPDSSKNKADLEYENDLQKAIALSLECKPAIPSEDLSQESKELAEASFLENFNNSDFASSSSSEDEVPLKPSKTSLTKLSSVKNYMLEYSGLTPNEISNIMGNKSGTKAKSKTLNLKGPNLASIPEICDSTAENLDESETVLESAVEIMSSSDSENEDDSREKVVVIDPNQSYNEEDDLFADVFNNGSIKDVMGDTRASSSDRINVSDNNENSTDLTLEKNTTTEFKEIDSGRNGERNANKSISSSLTSATEAKLPDSTSKCQTDEHLKKINAESAGDLCEAEAIRKSPTLTEGELMQLKSQLQRDKVDLLTERLTKERVAENITDQMYQEAQELLELFGVPYVVAPMEAEAQCAFLDAVDLTDGTITDDSDIWLFGGQTVYKNFFNQSKYVMEFRAKNIEHHFKLPREQMVLLALLVGSDYTVGLQGVGPVTAMEILAAFPPGKKEVNLCNISQGDLISGLKEFRSWFTKGKSPGPGRSSLKGKLKNLTFTENFPNLQVVNAYLDPQVETSKEAFSWGAPNAAALTEFAREKFGWTKLKTEEILNPVLKKFHEIKHQKSIRDFFKTQFKVHSGETEKKMSKRVKSAISNMGKDPSEVVVNEVQDALKKPRTKRAGKKSREIMAPEFKKSREDLSVKCTDAKPSKTVKKIKLNKSKTSAEPLPGSSEMSNLEEEKKQSDLAEDVTEKINAIRRRRKIKEAKTAVEIKKSKHDKDKNKLLNEVDLLPHELQVDEEVNLLAGVVTQSERKIEEINTTIEKKLKSVEAECLKNPPSSSGQATRNYRPENRPTRIFRKESIPQKDRDQSLLLRNKLKAIETFRKGKHGPGFVLRRERKRRLAKEDAELSESSDE